MQIRHDNNTANPRSAESALMYVDSPFFLSGVLPSTVLILIVVSIVDDPHPNEISGTVNSPIWLRGAINSYPRCSREANSSS